MTKLNDKIIRAAEPGTKITDTTGGHGDGRLMLVVSPKGLRSFVYRTQSGGKDLSKVIGSYPDMTLAAAREEVRRLSGRGIERTGSLEALLEAYRDSMLGRPSYGEVAASIKLNKIERIYRMAARDVTASDVAELLRAIVARGATVRVNRFRSLLSAAFNFAAKAEHDPFLPARVTRFKIENNPCALVPVLAEKPRDRVLTNAELKAYILGARKRDDAIGAFLELQVRTAQRFLQLYRSTIEGDTIVVIDTKGRGGRGRKVNRVPILDRKLVAAAEPAKAMNIDTIRRAATELLPEDANALDIRRTAETMLQAKVSREVRSKLLSHGAIGGGGGIQAKVYERNEMLPEVRAALRIWNGILDRIIRA